MSCNQPIHNTSRFTQGEEILISPPRIDTQCLTRFYAVRSTEKCPIQNSVSQSLSYGQIIYALFMYEIFHSHRKKVYTIHIRMTGQYGLEYTFVDCLNQTVNLNRKDAIFIDPSAYCEHKFEINRMILHRATCR